MRIAICDDNKLQLNMIARMLDKYTAPNGDRISYSTYGNALDLLDSMDNTTYDALLLDILMPGMNGLDVAKELRARQNPIPIVFLTSTAEFAVESYRVEAFDYLMKPVDGNALRTTMDKLSKTIEQLADSSLQINTAKSIVLVPYSQLEFLEVNNRTLTFYSISGNQKSIPGRLIDYEKSLLDRQEFMKVHRSYIVNFKHVREFLHTAFIMQSGTEIPISRNLQATVKQKYNEFLKSTV